MAREDLLQLHGWHRLLPRVALQAPAQRRGVQYPKLDAAHALF